jgi:hypothetical protein
MVGQNQFSPLVYYGILVSWYFYIFLAMIFLAGVLKVKLLFIFISMGLVFFPHPYPDVISYSFYFVLFFFVAIKVKFNKNKVALFAMGSNTPPFRAVKNGNAYKTW